METDSSMVGSIPLSINGQNQESNSDSGTSFGSLIVYPNPTQSKVTMEFVVEEIDHLNIQLVDKLGRTLTQKNSDYTPGVYTHTIDLTPYPVGFYSVVLTNKEGKQYKSIIKTN